MAERAQPASQPRDIRENENDHPGFFTQPDRRGGRRADIFHSAHVAIRRRRLELGPRRKRIFQLDSFRARIARCVYVFTSPILLRLVSHASSVAQRSRRTGKTGSLSFTIYTAGHPNFINIARPTRRSLLAAACSRATHACTQSHTHTHRRLCASPRSPHAHVLAFAWVLVGARGMKRDGVAEEGKERTAGVAQFAGLGFRFGFPFARRTPRRVSPSVRPSVGSPSSPSRRSATIPRAAAWRNRAESAARGMLVDQYCAAGRGGVRATVARAYAARASRGGFEEKDTLRQFIPVSLSASSPRSASPLGRRREVRAREVMNDKPVSLRYKGALFIGA